ncbi:unnamed protein product, partial [Cladocopium goreaui]
GDLWCLGCAGWEAIGRELGGHWDIGGAKVLANDLVLNCSRQVRALRSLGAGISTGGGRSVEAGQSRASVAPPPPAPGRDQGDRDTRTRSELPRQRATFNLPRPPSPPRRAKEEQVTEPLSEEEEEEEEEDEEGDDPEVRGDHTVQLATAVLSEVDHEEETEPEVLTHVNRSHGGEPKELGGNINDSNAWQRILCCESIEKLDQDGVEVDVTQLQAWSALSPARGQILEVALGQSNFHEAPAVWAAFVIVRVSTLLDGSLVLECRFLGSEDTSVDGRLDTDFNTEGNSIHLCLSRPCLDISEGEPDLGDFLHATRVRLWSASRFVEVCPYLSDAQKKNVNKFLKSSTEKPKAPRTPRAKAATAKTAPKEKKDRGKPGETGGKAAPRRKPALRTPKETEPGDPDIRASKEELRQKLKALRVRLQGDGKEEDQEYSPGTLVDEEQKDGLDVESSDPVQADGLTTGANLDPLPPELAKAVARKDKLRRSRRHTGGEDALALVDTKDTTSKSLSGQLVQKALEVTRQRKAKSSSKKKKKVSGKTDMERLSNVLVKALQKASGVTPKETEATKKKKRKRRMLRDGTIVTSSASSGASSGAETEEPSSDEDLEAPLRKKSRDRPGSVLQLLVAHIRDQLDQSALTETGQASAVVTGGVKVMTYFNIHVKGAYPQHLRELREMFHLASCIDAIRSGDVARCADGLAARFIALHQSLVDGNWGTARHLELHAMEDVTAASPSAILATRRHAKLVSKMQGYPSSSWVPGAGRGRGGKGKNEWSYGDTRGEAQVAEEASLVKAVEIAPQAPLADLGQILCLCDTLRRTGCVLAWGSCFTNELQNSGIYRLMFASSVRQRAGRKRLALPLREGELAGTVNTLKAVSLCEAAEDSFCTLHAEACWTYLACFACNSLVDVQRPLDSGGWIKAEERACAAVRLMTRRLLSHGRQEPVSSEGIEKDVKLARVNYLGEEVGSCHKLTLRQIGELPAITSALISCGVCDWIPFDDVLTYRGEVSERILLRSMLPAGEQVVRNRPLPLWMVGLLKEAREHRRIWWHVYLDNYAGGQVLGVSETSAAGDQLHQLAEKAWREAQVVSSEKKRKRAVEEAEELGALVSGATNTIGASPERILKVIQATLWILSQKHLSKKHVQVVAGRWVHILQFRRPGMAFLDSTWQFISSKTFSSRLVEQVKRELWRELIEIKLVGENVASMAKSECAQSLAMSYQHVSGPSSGADHHRDRQVCQGATKTLKSDGRHFLPRMSYAHLCDRMGLAPGFAAPWRIKISLARKLQYGKGRSGSRFLNKLLKVLNANLLAHGITLILGHVESTQNPTDHASRYYDAMRKLLPTLEKVKGPPQLDDAVSDWVEKQWREGQTIHVVSDALCGLHHFEPYTKKLIPSAWKLFRTWRKLEAPNRAPPLTKYIIYSLAHYAMMHNDLVFGTLLLMGFFGLLRTGELLLVKPCNILVAKERVILSLESTKSGKRNAASETVSFDDPFAVIAIDQLLQLREHQRLQHVPCWLHSAQNFRNKFSFYLKKFDLQGHCFRPYSLRRGGATHLFQTTGSMELALLKGRWGSAQVAKIYLQDGLSFLPMLTFSPRAREKLQEWRPFQHYSVK